MTSSLLTPFSLMYSGATSLRNRLFDIHVLKIQRLPVPVVSVGNITAGGTGKTPMVIHLAEWLGQKGIKVGIVSRGYRRSEKGTMEVRQTIGDAAGDEPVLMKRRLGDIPVFVSASRVEAGRALLDKYQVDLILADDAFQHRYLHRDLDIVLLDTTQGLAQYQTLPRGRAREPLTGLDRASQLIFTKTDTPESLTADELKSFLKESGVNVPMESVLEAQYVLGQPQPVSGQGEFDPGLKWTLLSGIGRPRAFESMCRKKWSLDIVDHRIHRDHHKYTMADLKDVGSVPVLTTEKDLVKLMTLPFDFSNWFYVPVEVQFKHGAERLYEDILRLCP